MLIRLIPPSPHPTILYGLAFPQVLSLRDLGPAATVPAAWLSQLHMLTSFLQLEPPSNIHMLDRAVGLVARVHEVTMDVPQKEFVLRFVDGRVANIPMNSDCVQILLNVVVDVKDCNEADSQRNSVEGSISPGSIASSTEDLPPLSPTKPAKPGRHKKQRSLLFSLISSLVPKSLSLSLPSPPSSAPPPAPLPPLPVTGRVTSPLIPQQISALPDHPEFLRRRARATLVNVWRRHVISALGLQHLPPAGYIEWTLSALAGHVRAEIESLGVTNSGGLGVRRTKRGRNKHRKTQSEGRNALDFGDRSDDFESSQWLHRPPSPFPGMLDMEDTDQVIYPRRGQADEWGVRYVHRPQSIDEIDIFAVEYDGYNDSLLSEHFTVGDDWDDTERVTSELSHMGRRGDYGNANCLSHFDDSYLHPGDFILDCSDDDRSGLANRAFDTSRCPLIPSDVNDDEQSDDSLVSLRSPENGDLPMGLSVQLAQDTSHSASQPSSVSRVGSSRPRSRNASAQISNSPPHAQSSTNSTPYSLSAFRLDCMSVEDDEFIASRLTHLDQICTALEVVRSRAREEGWRLVRPMLTGARSGWMDAETERTLEIKAKRRAWSSGIKISAPFPTSRNARKAWKGGSSAPRSPVRPPGLSSLTATLQVRGPIAPTGLSLGIPVQSSPLAMYAWSAADERKSTPSKYGILSSGRNNGVTENGRRMSRVTFADNVAKLFPVCEDEREDLIEPGQANAIGFPQRVPQLVAAEEPECSPIEGPAGKEEDHFYFYPSRPRTRTTSMYMTSSAPTTPPSPVLPMFRPSSPSPSYQAVTSGDVFTEGNEEGRLDASALLLQPLSSLISSPSIQPSPSRPPLIPNPPFAPRPRAVSLPTPSSYSSTVTTRRVSSPHKNERYEDLSQAYASPPPEGPLVVSATPAPHEQYPRYAHVPSPIPTSNKKMNAAILGRTGKEMVFEQAGSEFTVGIEVALGRAEEGRVVW